MKIRKRLLLIAGVIFIGIAMVTTAVKATDFKITKYDIANKVQQLMTDEDAEKKNIFNKERVKKGTYSLITKEEGDALTQFNNTEPRPSDGRVKNTSKAVSYKDVKITSQSGKIDEHLTIDNKLIKVTLCENKSLKTRQVFINGTDIIQRLAYIISNDLKEKDLDGYEFGERLCKSIPSNPVYSKEILETRDVSVTNDLFYKNTRLADKVYLVNLAAMQFAVEVATGDIFMVGGFDGRLTKIGVLK